MISSFLCSKIMYNLKGYYLQCYIGSPCFYYPWNFTKGPQDQLHQALILILKNTLSAQVFSKQKTHHKNSYLNHSWFFWFQKCSRIFDGNFGSKKLRSKYLDQYSYRKVSSKKLFFFWIKWVHFMLQKVYYSFVLDLYSTHLDSQIVCLYLLVTFTLSLVVIFFAPKIFIELKSPASHKHFLAKDRRVSHKPLRFISSFPKLFFSDLHFHICLDEILIIFFWRLF